MPTELVRAAPPFWSRWLPPRAQRLGDNEREFVAAVRSSGGKLKRHSDAELAKLVADLRADWPETLRAKSASRRAALATAFSLVNESLRRTRGHEFFDTQLLGGLAMVDGQIAEMQTGEGKTLTAGLAAMAGALFGKGVHVATPNAYLAARDAAQVAPVLERLGISLGVLGENDSLEAKQAAYRADVTYGMGYELGFDYLRDQLASRATQQLAPGEQLLHRLSRGHCAAAATVQRAHAVALVDEIDSVLIDEANTPLVISGAPRSARCDGAYAIARTTADRLLPDVDFTLDRAARQVQLTVEGERKVARPPAEASPFLARPWPQYIRHALVARWLFEAGVDYIVRDGRVALVDQNTGRVFQERTWREGLHQAVETQAGVPITSEGQTLAQIARQRYFQFYPRLAGMTGTTAGAEHEFRDVYGLSIARIAPRLPSRREVWPTRFFTSGVAKWEAIVEEIAKVHRSGRPVLVGARTIADSHALAERLGSRGIGFQLLNGCQDASEAEVVARAGQRGMITLATNMAGRGTDIPLGPEVAERGGLHVVGCERHRSARVDLQLLGRAGRQGDPGSGRFFVAVDDELLRLYGSRLARAIGRAASRAGESRVDFSPQLTTLQRRVERQDALLRRQLWSRQRWLDDIVSSLSGSA